VPTPTDVQLWATNAFGARGGDNLTIRANNIDSRANYSCRFVQLAEYEALPSSSGSGDGGNASQYMDVPATFEVEDDDGAAELRDLACVTPAWGAVYPGTDVRVLLLSDAIRGSDTFGYNTPSASGELVVHTRVWSSQFNYSFFEIWDALGTNDNRGRSLGARGGDNLTFAAWGLDGNANYSVAFTDLVTGISMVVPADVSGAPTLLTAMSPAWGTNFSAAHATITLFHSKSAGEGSSASASAAMVPSEATSTVLPQVEAGCCTAVMSSSSPNSSNVGSSPYVLPADASVVFVYRAPDNADATFDFFPVHNGEWHSAQGGLLNKTLIPGGPAHGGDVPLSIHVYGLDPLSWYTCRFVGRSNQSQVIDALPAQPIAPSRFSCFVPAWGALFPVDTTDVLLLVTTAQPSLAPSQSLASSSTPSLAPTPTSSILPSLVPSQAPSLSQLLSNSSRRALKQQRHLLVGLNASTPTPTVATTIVSVTDDVAGDDQSDDVGSWLWADGTAIADGTNHRSGLSYVFYAVVLGFESSAAYGAAGGDFLMFNTSGLDPSATNSAKQQCAFTSTIDRWETRVNASVGPGPSFAYCVTPSWGVWRPAERIEVELRLDYSDSTSNASSMSSSGVHKGWAAVNRGGDGSAGVNAGVVACVDVSGTATPSSEGGVGGVWQHDFYPAWQRVTLYPDLEARGGAAAGQEVVELLAYGLDANGTSSGTQSDTTATAVSASAYSESGGNLAVAALSGVGGLGGSYACGFRDARDVQRYLESPKSSRQEDTQYYPAITSTNVTCVTPSWGKLHPGTTTNLTLVYTPPPNLPPSSPLYYSGNVALVASNHQSNDDTSSNGNISCTSTLSATATLHVPKERRVNATLPFAFVPRFARVLAPEKYGAMGGDDVVFTGAGFRGGDWSIGTAAAHVHYECTFTPVLSLYETSVEPTIVPTAAPSTTMLPTLTPSAVARRRALLAEPSKAPTPKPNNITNEIATEAPSAQPSPLPSPMPSTSSPSPVPSTPPPSYLPTEPPTPSPTRYRGVVGACQENATVLIVNATNVNATSLTCQTPSFGAAACATNMALTVSEVVNMNSLSSTLNSGLSHSSVGERLLPLARSPALNLNQGALSRWVDDHVDDYDDKYADGSLTTDGALPAAGTILDASEGSVFYPVPPTLHGVLNATYGPGATVYGHYGDSAYGGTQVLLACYGLDSAATYAARWSLKPDETTGRRSSANLTTLCDHHDWGQTFTHTSIVCWTPLNWGVQFAAGEAQIELLRVDTSLGTDEYEVLFVTTNDGISTLETSANSSSSSSVVYVGGEGARTAVGFVFVAVLGQAVPADVAGSVPGFVDTAGRAGGGQTIGFAGVGFDPLGSYRCHFYTGTAPYAIENSLYSPEVPARSTELLLCETPAWGRTFPAASVTIRVQYKTGLSVASTSSSTDDEDNATSLTNSSNSEQRRQRRLASDVGDITEVGDGEVLFEDENGDYWSFIVGPEKYFDFALEVCNALLRIVSYWPLFFNIVLIALCFTFVLFFSRTGRCAACSLRLRGQRWHFVELDGPWHDRREQHRVHLPL